MKWWHFALGLGLAYLLLRPRDEAEGDVVIGTPKVTPITPSGDVIIGTPKLTPTTDGPKINADTYARLVEIFARRYAPNASQTGCGGTIQVTTGAYGIVNVICIPLHWIAPPTILANYPSLAVLAAMLTDEERAYAFS